MGMPIVLRIPREDEEAEVLRAHRGTSPTYPNFLHYYQEGMSFARYLDVLREQERGEHLPPRHVPSTFLFAFVEPRIVGRVSIRHTLNPFLERLARTSVTPWFQSSDGRATPRRSCVKPSGSPENDSAWIA
jgi:predicted acetyltransferase